MSQDQWSKVYIPIVWSIIVGFAGLCILGFFNLSGRIEANASEDAKTKIEISVLSREVGIIGQDVKWIIRYLKNNRGQEINWNNKDNGTSFDF